MGLILDEDIQALRDRVDIVELISEYVQLKQKGPRQHWGLCPFHDEKSASFKVDRESQMFHCFGCGAGGDAFTFVMRVENMNYPEALQALADKHSIELRRAGGDRGEARLPGERTERERLFEANDLAARFFRAMLEHERFGESARQYLDSRGMDSGVAEEYNLGYAPASDDSLINALRKKDVSDADLLKAGLVRTSENRRSRDMFRGRLIFPINDMQGRVVAFGGRVIGDGIPKYLNTPETQLFSKGSLLYGLDRAKKEIGTLGRAVVVEGYTDVIALRSAGIHGVVGTLGTSLTPQHIRLLKRFTDRIVLLFDGDKAGVKAAERVLGLGEDVLTLSVVELPEGRDPADAVAESGAKWLEDRISTPVPLLEYAVELIVRRSAGGDSNRRLSAAKEAIRVLSGSNVDGGSRIGLSGVVGSACVRILSQRLGIDEAAIRSELSAQTRSVSSPGRFGTPIASVTPEEAAEREALRVLLSSERPDTVLERLDESDFIVPAYKELVTVLRTEGPGIFDASRFHALPGELQSLVSGLRLDPLPTDNTEEYVSGVLAAVNSLALGRRISDIRARLEALGSSTEEDEVTRGTLFAQLMELERERARIHSVRSAGGGY